MRTTKANPNLTPLPALPEHRMGCVPVLCAVQMCRPWQMRIVHVFLLLRGPHHRKQSVGSSQAAFQLHPWGSMVPGSSIVNGATDVGVCTDAILVALGYLYTSLLWAMLHTSWHVSRCDTATGSPETLGSIWWAPFCARLIFNFFFIIPHHTFYSYSFGLHTFPVSSVPSHKLCSWPSKINQGHLHDCGVGAWRPHLWVPNQRQCSLLSPESIYSQQFRGKGGRACEPLPLPLLIANLHILVPIVRLEILHSYFRLLVSLFHLAEIHMNWVHLKKSGNRNCKYTSNREEGVLENFITHRISDL